MATDEAAAIGAASGEPRHVCEHVLHATCQIIQIALILYLHELIHQLILTFDHVLAANTDSMFCISS